MSSFGDGMRETVCALLANVSLMVPRVTEPYCGTVILATWVGMESFMEITGADASTATHFIEAFGGNLDVRS